MKNKWKPKKAQNGLNTNRLHEKKGTWRMTNDQVVSGTAFKQDGKVYIDQGNGNIVQIDDSDHIIYPLEYASSFDGSLSNFTNTINAMTGGIANRFSPTQNIRAVYDLFDNDLSTQDKINSIVYGNNGIVSNNFAEKHPYISAGINLIGDTASPRSLLNTAIKSKATQLVTDAKSDLAKAIYNNIAPGSYKESYIKGGTKRTEIKNALKDFLKGNTKEINPKWVDWVHSEDFASGFTKPSNLRYEDLKKYSQIVGDARQEAWERYLGLPTSRKYIKDTGRTSNGIPITTSDLGDIPQTQLQIAADVQNGKLEGDLINSIGGNLTPRIGYRNGNAYITYDDIWDIQPFQDANRTFLPKSLVKRMSHIEVQPDGYKKVVWDKWVPKKFREIEVGDFLGYPGKFRNITTIKAKVIPYKDTFVPHTMTKEDYVNRATDMFSSWYEGDNFIDELNKVAREESDKYDELLRTNPEKLKEYKHLSWRDLLSRYGVHRVE